MYNKETNVLTVGDHQLDVRVYLSRVGDMLARPAKFWKEDIHQVKLAESLIGFAAIAVVVAIAQVLLSRDTMLFTSVLVGAAMQIAIGTGILYGLSMVFKSKEIQVQDLAKAVAMLGAVTLPLGIVSMLPSVFFYKYMGLVALGMGVVSLFLAYQMLKNFMELNKGQLQIVLAVPVLIQIGAALPLVLMLIRGY